MAPACRPASRYAGKSSLYWKNIRLMTIDERLEALTMNLELAFRDIIGLKETTEHLRDLAQKDGENIRALARIAEAHQHRIEHLEEGR